MAVRLEGIDTYMGMISDTGIGVLVDPEGSVLVQIVELPEGTPLGKVAKGDRRILTVILRNKGDSVDPDETPRYEMHFAPNGQLIQLGGTEVPQGDTALRDETVRRDAITLATRRLGVLKRSIDWRSSILGRAPIVRTE